MLLKTKFDIDIQDKKNNSLCAGYPFHAHIHEINTHIHETVVNIT